MKIYTKTGDDGTTSLYGGKRIEKYNQQVVAYGSVDELNSVLGVLISHLSQKSNISRFLTETQNDLLKIGSYLAGGKISIKNVVKSVEEIEKFIDKLNEKLPNLQNFILPQGTVAASFSHEARAVCRRAEREVTKLVYNKLGEKNFDKGVIVYLNRLSDLFFIIARYLNFETKTKELIWKGNK